MLISLPAKTKKTTKVSYTRHVKESNIICTIASPHFFLQLYASKSHNVLLLLTTINKSQEQRQIIFQECLKYHYLILQTVSFLLPPQNTLMWSLIYPFKISWPHVSSCLYFISLLVFSIFFSFPGIRAHKQLEASNVLQPSLTTSVDLQRNTTQRCSINLCNSIISIHTIQNIRFRNSCFYYYCIINWVFPTQNPFLFLANHNQH